MYISVNNADFPMSPLPLLKPNKVIYSFLERAVEAFLGGVTFGSASAQLLLVLTFSSRSPPWLSSSLKGPPPPGPRSPWGGWTGADVHGRARRHSELTLSINTLGPISAIHMVHFKSVCTVLGQIKFTRHSSVALMFVR